MKTLRSFETSVTSQNIRTCEINLYLPLIFVSSLLVSFCAYFSFIVYSSSTLPSREKVPWMVVMTILEPSDSPYFPFSSGTPPIATYINQPKAPVTIQGYNYQHSCEYDGYKIGSGYRKARCWRRMGRRAEAVDTWDFFPWPQYHFSPSCIEFKWLGVISRGIKISKPVQPCGQNLKQLQ
jgi:hypothetical protein